MICVSIPQKYLVQVDRSFGGEEVGGVGVECRGTPVARLSDAILQMRHDRWQARV